jgi:hypothetical protein
MFILSFKQLRRRLRLPFTLFRTKQRAKSAGAGLRAAAAVRRSLEPPRRPGVHTSGGLEIPGAQEGRAVARVPAPGGAPRRGEMAEKASRAAAVEDDTEALRTTVGAGEYAEAAVDAPADDNNTNALRTPVGTSENTAAVKASDASADVDKPTPVEASKKTEAAIKTSYAPADNNNTKALPPPVGAGENTEAVKASHPPADDNSTQALLTPVGPSENTEAIQASYTSADDVKPTPTEASQKTAAIEAVHASGDDDSTQELRTPVEASEKNEAVKASRAPATAQELPTPLETPHGPAADTSTAGLTIRTHECAADVQPVQSPGPVSDPRQASGGAGTPASPPRNISVSFPKTAPASPRRVGSLPPSASPRRGGSAPPSPAPQGDSEMLAEMQASLRSRESKRALQEAAERERTLRALGLPAARTDEAVAENGRVVAEDVRAEIRTWRKERETSLRGTRAAVLCGRILTGCVQVRTRLRGVARRRRLRAGRRRRGRRSWQSFRRRGRCGRRGLRTRGRGGGSCCLRRCFGSGCRWSRRGSEAIYYWLR